MKPSHVAEGMTYSLAEIAERNKYVDARCAEIRPMARELFETAVRRHTSRISAEAIAEEARTALSELLANQEEVARLDKESAELARALAESFKEKPAPRDAGEEEAWLERRSKDLARAVVGFWMNLGSDEMLRYKASLDVLDEFAVGKDTRRGRNFKTIYARFWLRAAEAGKLLSSLATVNVAIPIAEITGTSLPDTFCEQLVERFFQPQPASLLARLRARDLTIVDCARAMPDYAKFKVAMPLFGSMDRIYKQKKLAIQQGSQTFRDRRYRILYRNKAIACEMIEKTVAASARSAKPVNTRLKTTHRLLKNYSG